MMNQPESWVFIIIVIVTGTISRLLARVIFMLIEERRGKFGRLNFSPALSKEDVHDGKESVLDEEVVRDENDGEDWDAEDESVREEV